MKTRSLIVAVLCTTPLLVAAAVSTGCKKDPPPIAEAAPPPKASAAKALEVGESSYTINAAGKASILIDAPEEKIKGATEMMGGFITINPTHLKKSTATITANLEKFTTNTFTDKEKNATQTEHAINWFELGEDVRKTRPADYENYRDVIFKADSIESVSADNLINVKEESGVRTVSMKINGTVWVHSRPAPKTVSLEVKFTGPPEAPTSISFKTTEPFLVSLLAHDVKPRNISGKILGTASSLVGKKIDDSVQISVEGTAVLTKSAAAVTSASALADAKLKAFKDMPATPSASASGSASGSVSASTAPGVSASAPMKSK